MSIATAQLEEIFEETKLRFVDTNVIEVTPIAGAPPDKYEITYRIKGMHTDDTGELTEQDNHLVTINIPFGFPHFPPSCIPNSPIYHPDFDPAAICIGDFWDQDKTLSDLIIYIGQLISGELFSSENAFNEDAATWYNDNENQLPFDTLTIDSAPATKASTTIDEIEDQSDDLELDLDTIQDQDLDSDFNYLSMDEPTEDPSFPPSLESKDSDSERNIEEPDVDLDLILLLKRKKRYNALNHHLATLPSNIQFDQKPQIEKLLKEELEAAQILYGQAEEFEHKGSPQKALERYQEVQLRVSDFPAIEEDIERAKQSFELLGGLTEEEESLDKEAATSAPAPPTKEIKPKEKPKKDLTFFEDKENKKTMGSMPIAIGSVVIIIAITLGYFYFSINSQFTKAQALFSLCEQELGQNKFSSADKSCSDALGETKKVQFLKTNEKAQLITSITRTLKSAKLKQGLAGNILYNGKYIPSTSLKAIEEFNTNLKAGNDALAKQEWKKAQDSYDIALALAAANSVIDQEILPEIKGNRAIAAFSYSYDIGQTYIDEQRWDTATEQLTAAQQALQLLDSQTKKDFQTQIDLLLSQASYHNLSEKSADLFQSGKWQEAIEAYNEILKSSATYLSAHPNEKKALNEKLTKAELYYTIQSGKDAFANANWDEAIRNYDTAIRVLNENKEILSQVNSAENREKLSKIKLQASIIRDKQEAARRLKVLNYDSAILKLQTIVNSIQNSPFSSEQEFIIVLEEITETIDNAQNAKFIAENISYLEENYKSIFVEINPATTADSLHDPRISFVKKINESYLFKLQCVEKGRGRPLRLVVNYLYNPTSDSWSFYTQ